MFLTSRFYRPLPSPLGTPHHTREKAGSPTRSPLRQDGWDWLPTQVEFYQGPLPLTCFEFSSVSSSLYPDAHRTNG